MRENEKRSESIHASQPCNSPDAFACAGSQDHNYDSWPACGTPRVPVRASRVRARAVLRGKDRVVSNNAGLLTVTQRLRRRTRPRETALPDTGGINGALKC